VSAVNESHHTDFLRGWGRLIFCSIG